MQQTEETKYSVINGSKHCPHLTSNVFLKRIFICYCHSKIFQISHILNIPVFCHHCEHCAWNVGPLVDCCLHAGADLLPSFATTVSVRLSLFCSEQLCFLQVHPAPIAGSRHLMGCNKHLLRLYPAYHP